IHETGLQLFQTGRLCRPAEEYPHLGSVVARLKGAQRGMPPFAILPRPIQRTGIDVPHGQSAGWLGPAYAPLSLDADPAAPPSRPSDGFWTASARNAFHLETERRDTREAYGRTTFGQCCLLARRLVEAGSRVVTVNMYETVFNHVSWDCHGASPFSTLRDYAQTVLPPFDQAFTALLADLERRRLLE